MTKLPVVDIHVRVPEETKDRAQQMADAAAPKGKAGDLGVWLTDLIEVEWERQQRGTKLVTRKDRTRR